MRLPQKANSQIISQEKIALVLKCMYIHTCILQKGLLPSGKDDFQIRSEQNLRGYDDWAGKVKEKFRA